MLQKAFLKATLDLTPGKSLISADMGFVSVLQGDNRVA